MQWLDPANILLLAVVALVVLGPERIPGAFRTLGKYWAEFQRIRTEAETHVREVVGNLGVPNASLRPADWARDYARGFRPQAISAPAGALPEHAAPSEAKLAVPRGGGSSSRWTRPGRLVSFSPDSDPSLDDPICN